MCGIGGVYFKNKVDEGKLSRFKELIKEKQGTRGPDHFDSLKVTDDLYFFHNRLSIIDLNSSFQPIQNEEGAMVYNGEIYNYKNININQKKFNSDTLLLLEGLNKSHVDFFKETNSMFGIGYFNFKSHILTLARDRIGIKQVYYIETDEVFAFASTLTPLVIFSTKNLNVGALGEFYLNRAFKAPNTIFTDIKLLQSGSYVEFNIETNKSNNVKKWWERDQLENKYSNEPEIIDKLDSVLHESVKDRLVADVPVGAFLSGGVDSSLITAIATKYYENLETFTVAMKDKRYDESEYAKLLSKKYNLRYNEIVVDEEKFIDGIDEWIELQDDIVSDPSALLLFKISKFSRESGFKVMLAGEGADELFGGYNSYQRYLLSLKYHKYFKLLKPVNGIVSNLFKNDSRKKHFISNLIHNPQFFGTALVYEPYLLEKMLKEDATFFAASGLKNAMDLDLKDRLPNDVLIRSDRATMGASIEARVPFLSHQLINFAGKIDESLYIKNRETKYLVKKLAEKYIPHDNIYRKKVGFDLPIEHWFRNELKFKMQELIDSSIQKDIINLNVIKEIFDNHVKGKTNASAKLWAFMSLELSYRYLSKIN